MPTLFSWTGNTENPWCFEIRNDARDHLLHPGSWTYGLSLWTELHDINRFKATLVAYLDYQERYAEKLCGINKPKPRSCAVM